MLVWKLTKWYLLHIYSQLNIIVSEESSCDAKKNLISQLNDPDLIKGITGNRPRWHNMRGGQSVLYIYLFLLQNNRLSRYYI